jgi:hypothetical protein
MIKEYEDIEFHGLITFFRDIAVNVLANLTVSGSLIVTFFKGSSMYFDSNNEGALEMYFRAGSTFSSVSLFMGDTANSAKQSIVANHVNDTMSLKIGATSVVNITDAGIAITGSIDKTTVAENVTSDPPLHGELESAFPNADNGSIVVLDNNATGNNSYIAWRDTEGAWYQVKGTKVGII